MTPGSAVRLELAASPHVKGPDSTERIMWTVVVTLLPVTFASVWFFGLGALLVVLAAIVFQVWSLLRVARLEAGFPSPELLRGARYVIPFVWEVGVAAYILHAFPA